MKKLRLLVPVAVIAAVVILLMAPAGALAASNQYGSGHGGWNDGKDGWHGNGGDNYYADHEDGWRGKGGDNYKAGYDDGRRGYGGDNYKAGYDDSWHGDRGGACHDGFTYKVRWGDTLGNIAARFGVSSTYLAQVNDICNPNRIYAGQALWIPGGGCW
jgi:hypothetical protein